jgi:hypothetical protein
MRVPLVPGSDDDQGRRGARDPEVNLLCVLRGHDWRFVKMTWRYDEEHDDRPIIWSRVIACQRCHTHGTTTAISRLKDYVPKQSGPARRKWPKNAQWDDVCAAIIPDRHGPGVDGECTHTRGHHGIDIGGEWYDGACKDCHCKGFTET